jgi:hypothetical protein
VFQFSHYRGRQLDCEYETVKSSTSPFHVGGLLEPGLAAVLSAIRTEVRRGFGDGIL